MHTLTPTKDLGATSKASDRLYVEPDCQITDDELAALAPDLDLNIPFVMDWVSAVLTHERCGAHLYRSVAGRTNNPVLKRRYGEFGKETERHVEILENLVTTAGGNPMYVSPAARATEGTDSKILESTFLIAGSIDVMTQEMAMLDAVLLAESMDHANWEVMAMLAERLPEGDLKTAFEEAVRQVEPEEDEHLTWAKETKARMVMLQAESRTMTAAGAKAEELIEKIKDWLSD
jgi:rubrerythrin